MTRSTATIAGLVVVGLALGWWALGRTRDPAPAPSVPVATPPTTAAAKAVPAVATTAEQPAASRTEAPPVRSTAALPALPQGLRGLVVDGANRPLPGRAVYLVDSASNEPIALPLLRQQRDAFGPVASTETAEDGTFAVGLSVAQDRLYELYVMSPAHATARLGGLRLLAGEWHDLGTITLTPGATVRGRVAVAGRDDLPVPGASVTVEIGAVFADAALRALPGAGNGLVATTDNLGRYELQHVPSRGIVQISAVANGFAYLRKPNIELRLDQPVEVDFALLPGQTLAGTVSDDKGGPIVGARVEAWPMDAAGDPLVGHSGADGRFTVLGLGVAKQRVRVAARGFDTQDQPDVEPGRSDVNFTLVPQSVVRVRVVTPRGETLRSYQLALRRSFDENDQIAGVADVPDQRVRLDGMTDFTELRCVPVGIFRCQVEADGWAKTLSEPFRNLRKPDETPQPRLFEVVVTMTTGASLRGRVVDETGAPLAGAAVRTEAAGNQPDHPLFRLLAGALPGKITAARTTTGTDGSFALSLLALADYQLVVEHDAACRGIVSDLHLDAPGERTLPPITLVTGALVSGRATVDGRIAGQIKVVLTTPPALANAKDALRLETVTDAAGAWRMPRRVPPGTYELRAAVVGTTEPEAQIFRQLLQLQQSNKTVVVPPGQRQVESDIDLLSDH
jgi:hypothetical protein